MRTQKKRTRAVRFLALSAASRKPKAAANTQQTPAIFRRSNAKKQQTVASLPSSPRSPQVSNFLWMRTTNEKQNARLRAVALARFHLSVAYKPLAASFACLFARVFLIKTHWRQTEILPHTTSVDRKPLITNQNKVKIFSPDGRLSMVTEFAVVII